jgi:hypothetical protein
VYAELEAKAHYYPGTLGKIYTIYIFRIYFAESVGGDVAAIFNYCYDFRLLRIFALPRASATRVM